MFERFTDRARQVVVLAQDESRGFRHQYIGSEHLLLGLIREEEGMAAHVFALLGVSLDGVREQVTAIVGRGAEPVSGQIPFTPQAKKILELALREALALGHNYIGTEHILLGLMREDDGVATQILGSLGVDGPTVRVELEAQLAGGSSAVEWRWRQLARLIDHGETRAKPDPPTLALSVGDLLTGLVQIQERAIKNQDDALARDATHAQIELLRLVQRIEASLLSRDEQPEA